MYCVDLVNVGHPPYGRLETKEGLAIRRRRARSCQTTCPCPYFRHVAWQSDKLAGGRHPRLYCGMSTNRENIPWNATVMVSVGPLRCFATMRSASP